MKTIIIVAFLLSAGAGIVNLYPYRQELSTCQREWSSFQRHISCFRLQTPLLSRSIARSDPEAAAIVEWLLHEDHHNFRDIEYLSEMSVRFPENQYFLYDLACTIASKGYTDPQIVNVLADRLLELDPDNGRYYFQKAWAAFYDWRPDRIEMTLQYLDRCFSAGQADPLDFYRERIDGLVEKEQPTIYICNQIHGHCIFDAFLSRKLVAEILEYTQDLIVNGREEEAVRIHDRIQQIAENSIPQTIAEPWRFWLSFPPSGYYGIAADTPQAVELKWMQLSTERAKQNRMQMLGWKTLSEKVAEQRQESKPKADTDYRGYVLNLVPPGAHCFEMVIAGAAAFGLFAAAGLMLKMQKSRLSFLNWLGVGLFFIGYFILCRWGDYNQMHLCCGGHYTFDYVLMSSNIGAVLSGVKEVGWLTVTLVAVTGVIGAVLLPLYLCKPCRLRYVFLHAAAVIFLFLLWLMFSNWKYIIPVFHVSVLWLIVPLLCLPSGKSRPFADLFSRTPEGRQFRTRCLAVSFCLLALHAVGFGLLGQSFLMKVAAGVEKERIDHCWPAFTPPQYETNPEQYANLLMELKTQKVSQTNLHRLLSMVEPEDIPAVLTTIRQERQNDPNYYGYWSMFRMGSYEADTPVMFLDDLAGALDYCGKDVIPAIIPFLENPDSPMMLNVRGRAGDLSVHDRLMEAWRKYRDTGFPNDDFATPMIDESQTIPRVPLECLVNICPYPEFKECVLTTAKFTGMENGYFILNRGIIQHLSREQKGELITELLEMNDSKRLSPSTLLEVLHRDSALGPAAKENLWKQVIAYETSKLGWKEVDLNVSNKPNDYEIPDELLTACINSKDERLRAMGQHICRVTGRPMDEQTMQQWLNDPYFIIRANAVLLRPGLSRPNDPSHFVRLISSLMK
jgi:hypothetical protein